MSGYVRLIAYGCRYPLVFGLVWHALGPGEIAEIAMLHEGETSPGVSRLKTVDDARVVRRMLGDESFSFHT